MNGKICESCKKKTVNDVGTVSFFCPGCSQLEIVRCRSCRSNAVQYSCAQCGFTGPN